MLISRQEVTDFRLEDSELCHSRSKAGRPGLTDYLPLAWQRELSPVVLVAWPGVLHHGVSEHLLHDTEDGVVVGDHTLHVSTTGPPLGETNDWEEWWKWQRCHLPGHNFSPRESPQCLSHPSQSPHYWRLALGSLAGVLGFPDSPLGRSSASTTV